MPGFRIHRLKYAPSESFRWAPHTGGLAIVKEKDYEPAGQIEAASPYAAWKLLATESRALHPGDLLETDLAPGELHIFKYIGFEPAKWYVPDPKPEPDPSTTPRTSREAVPHP